MTLLHEIIEVARPVHEAFAYVSDFTTTTQWDATAIEATKLTPGPIVEGTCFKVICRLPVGSVTLRYEIEKLEANKYLQLRGTSKMFDVVDIITFEPTKKGTRIDYKAEFEFKSWLQPVAKLAANGMQKMGAESLAGMKEALDDKFTVRETSSAMATADSLVVPGLSLFSKLGYNLARKHFNPMSAYLADRHIVITGASSGLGYAAALSLAQRGAQLTLVMRDSAKAKKTVEDLQWETGNTQISAELADLSLMADVDSLVRRMKKRGKTVDVLINNAGALFNPRRETEEGLEQSFALLLLSPYRLTLGLKPLLSQSDAPRVINVVSGGMYSQALEVDKLLNDDGEVYSGSVAYAREKRALMVVTQEWAQEWTDEGITVNAMHPGWADTPGVRDALPEFRKVAGLVLRTAQEGADTIVWLAAASEAVTVSGELFLDRQAHTPHLLKRTTETAAEKVRLMRFLSKFKV